MTRSASIATFCLLAVAAQAEPKAWSLDVGHAHVGWEIDHMGLGRTVGGFIDFDGTFLIDDAEPANSRITFAARAASVDSNHVGRDNHVRSADFLDVGRSRRSCSPPRMW